MIKLVIINGLGGVGKSTFVTDCTKYCEEKYPEVVVLELSTVDFVKQIALQCGWKGTKSNKDRVFLSDLKNAMAKWANLPIEDVFRSIDYEILRNPNYDHVFFINSREPEDIEEICKIAYDRGYDCEKMLVKNPNAVVNEVSELIEGITSVKYDKVIINDGDLDSLKLEAQQYIEEILK